MTFPRRAGSVAEASSAVHSWLLALLLFPSPCTPSAQPHGSDSSHQPSKPEFSLCFPAHSLSLCHSHRLVPTQMRFRSQVAPNSEVFPFQFHAQHSASDVLAHRKPERKLAVYDIILLLFQCTNRLRVFTQS